MKITAIHLTHRSFIVGKSTPNISGIATITSITRDNGYYIVETDGPTAFRIESSSDVIVEYANV
jgi:hypothetical protein